MAPSRLLDSYFQVIFKNRPPGYHIRNDIGIIRKESNQLFVKQDFNEELKENHRIKNEYTIAYQ